MSVLGMGLRELLSLTTSQKTSTPIFTFGYPLFAARWNSDLTMRTKGVSHIVYTLLCAFAIVALLINAYHGYSQLP
jgi:hypothetical protein